MYACSTYVCAHIVRVFCICVVWAYVLVYTHYACITSLVQQFVLALRNVYKLESALDYSLFHLSHQLELYSELDLWLQKGEVV